MRCGAILVAAAMAALLPWSISAAAESADAGAAESQQQLSQGELDQLAAPSRFIQMPSSRNSSWRRPIRWKLFRPTAGRRANKSLKGDKLDDALTKQDWDASVKALVATPTVLTMMNDDLDWTEKLGDAVLAQQADVMDAIQRLRAKAQANGKLATTKQQKVSVTQEADKPVIVIEPASPETVYVPYYEPTVVYGAWPYPDYPPYYFPPAPGWVGGGALARGIAWGAGFAVGNAIWDGLDWAMATFASTSTRT